MGFWKLRDFTFFFQNYYGTFLKIIRPKIKLTSQLILQTTAKEIEALGVKAIAVSCNVLKDEDLVNLVDTTVRELGGIHILINNAGGGGGGRENPFKISVEDIKRDYELNVFSGWRLCQLVVPHYEKRWVRVYSLYNIYVQLKQKPQHEWLWRF